MTRQEAIKRLSLIMHSERIGWNPNTVEALQMAIDALGADNNVGDISKKPEIICKNCKYSEKWYGDKLRCFLWDKEGIDVWDTGFCNYAERRTDEQSDRC